MNQYSRPLWSAAFFLWGLFSAPVSATAQNVPWEALTIEHGLSQGMVYDVLQTKDGFLWVGTKDGLNRYDGYNFRVWDNDPANSYTLSDNTVTTLLEDSRGLLWLGSESGAVHVFDRKTERFYHIGLPAKSSERKQVSHNVEFILEDKQRNIWIVNRRAGIFRLTVPDTWESSLPDTSDLTGFCDLRTVDIRKIDPTDSGQQEEFTQVCAMQDGSIWICSSKGFYRTDPRTLVATPLPETRSLPQGVTGLLQTPSGIIWGGTRNGVFQINNGEVRIFDLGENEEVGTRPILKMDQAGGIWILMEKKVWYVEPQGELQIGQPEYLLDKPSNTLALDKQGNIWIGTLGYGLRKMNPRKSMFHATLKGTSVWGVWQDKSGRIFCKLYNNIVEYNRFGQQVSAKTAFPKAMSQQNDLIYEPSGDFWLLSGLRKGKIDRSLLQHYRADHTLLDAVEISLDRYPHARLLRTADGHIWMSGTSGYLLRYNPSTGALTSFDFSRLFGDQAPALMTFALVEDGNGTLWAGTQLGLVKGVWQNNTLNFQLLQTGSPETGRMNNNSIACLLPDPKDPRARLWIGTKGGGINCLDLRTGEVHYITTAQGLPNDVVYGLLPDAAGHLWGSTNRGLFKLTLDGDEVKDIKLFTAADGLQDNEFNTQAFFKAPNGELLFGGVNGLNRFLPEALELNKQPPNVRIVGLQVNYREERFPTAGIELTAPLEYLNLIRLMPELNNLSFEFAALDFTEPAKNRYRYQLLPLETEWVEAGTRHFAHYTHLRPGNYIFRVQGSNNDGVWNETPLEMSVFIPHPWWQSRLAIFCYLVLLSLVIWRIYRSHANSIRLKEQVAFEQREIERIRALEQVKTNFFSNVAHEFRTPLTLTIEPLRQVLKKPESADWLPKVRLAARNSQKLLYLINELLDLAKLESGAMKADYRSSNIGDILRPAVESFAGAAENRQVDLRLVIKQEIRGDFDEDKIDKICFNLISNALKFTPPGGKITVTAETVPAAANPSEKWLHIAVDDSGKGIPPADLSLVFERFYQSPEVPERNQLGTGIGLALCRELTELMNGTIHAENNPGGGAVFHLYLPLWQHTSGQAMPIKNPGSAHPDQQPEEQAAALPLVPAAAMPEITDHARPLLLLVEDNEELRAFLLQILTEFYEVLEAPDGKDAVELAIQHVPDIVVSDIFMPRMDGIELLASLKKNVVTSHIPVLLLTSKTTLEDRLEGVQQGADAYLGKPFQTEELLAWINNLLESRRHLQEKFAGTVQAPGNGRPADLDTMAAEASAPVVLSALDRQFLEKLRQVTESEIENENLSIEEMARQMMMSRSQLHRKLSALTGQSASEFLRNYRLDRAMELLRAKAGNVSEIAWQVGYSNSKYFSTSFKERFGISPSEV